MAEITNQIDSVKEVIKRAIDATVRNEEWKYTHVQFLLRDDFVVDNTFVIDNDYTSHVNEVKESWLLRTQNPFVKLTEALRSDIQVIDIPDNTVIDQPFHLNFDSNCTDHAKVQATRIRINVGKNSSLTIVESHAVRGENACLDLNVTEFVIHPNAHVVFVKLIDSPVVLRHVSSTFAQVGCDASFTSFALCINGSFVRNDLQVSLAEQGANAYLYGASVLDESEFSDNHTVVDHEVAHCHSEELYKGVYGGKSVGVFNGKIFVRPHAQKTTAYQSCKSILTSTRAQVNVKPQLEIWADDVKCSHGAATGQIDEEALFYLRTRGLSLDIAKALITYAHAAEPIENIAHEGIRTDIKRRIAYKLGATDFQ